eukprot:TRINITY_DN66004_c0_g1_i1.p1 TRINITY_DN66004_c0_g1~~TRINITY_DN66004_c0_g1_i1.p1  ORF type:complete len:389 (+),score=86.75 TRINITY_DN66004_c0_g1_i1:35-1201(+)
MSSQSFNPPGLVQVPPQRISLADSLSATLGIPDADAAAPTPCKTLGDLDEAGALTSTSASEQEGLPSSGPSPVQGFQPYHSRAVPKLLDLEACANENAVPGAPVTTLMLRNIPNKYTQNTLMKEINHLGFQGTFNFFYLPMDIHNRSNVGYAFINFISAEEAERFWKEFDGHDFGRFRSRKVAAVCKAHLQGLDANIRHFQHRAITMARNDQYRPAVIRNGQRIQFDVAVAEVQARTAALSSPTSRSTTCSSSSSVVEMSPSASPMSPSVTVPPQDTEIPLPYMAEVAQQGFSSNPRLDLEAAIRDLLKKNLPLSSSPVPTLGSFNDFGELDRASSPYFGAPTMQTSEQMHQAWNGGGVPELLALRSLLINRLVASRRESEEAAAAML